ncbi:hypothetical protein J7L60_04705 [Candidatus Bathyarchaeota archaeon]|nr:hypothetical protein [Candidatus Bathyarchaeota archaeon]
MSVIYEHWKPSVLNLSKAMKLIEGYFGKGWLRSQIKALNRKPKYWYKKFSHHLKSKPHPISLLYSKAEENLRLLKKNPDIGFTKESLKLMSFSDMLSEIENIDVVDINGNPIGIKSWDIFKKRLKNKKEFKQASYEIQIASAFKRSGLEVQFIKESTKIREKTPDLLLKEGETAIYIECKYRNPTKREILYDNLFNEFYSRVMGLMYRLGKFYSICVEWTKEPTLKYIESEIELINKKISNNEQGYLETENAKIWLKKLASSEKVLEGPFKFDVSEYRSEQTDIFMSHADVGIFDGKVKHKNPTFVMFRNISYINDLTDGIVELLNKAYSQIPKEGPGIVFLETPLSYLNQSIKGSLQDLERKLIGKLNIIGRINMVILTRSYLKERRIKVNNRNALIITRQIESRIISNRKPRTSVPQDIISRIKALKYY